MVEEANEGCLTDEQRAELINDGWAPDEEYGWIAPDGQFCVETAEGLFPVRDYHDNGRDRITEWEAAHPGEDFFNRDIDLPDAWDPKVDYFDPGKTGRAVRAMPPSRLLFGDEPICVPLADFCDEYMVGISIAGYVPPGDRHPAGLVIALRSPVRYRGRRQIEYLSVERVDPLSPSRVLKIGSPGVCMNGAWKWAVSQYLAAPAGFEPLAHAERFFHTAETEGWPEVFFPAEEAVVQDFDPLSASILLPGVHSYNAFETAAFWMFQIAEKREPSAPHLTVVQPSPKPVREWLCGFEDPEHHTSWHLWANERLNKRMAAAG